jgi:hypothetical protein
MNHYSYVSSVHLNALCTYKYVDAGERGVGGGGQDGGGGVRHQQVLHPP